MRALLAILALVFVSASLCVAAEQPQLANQQERDSYSLGYRFGEDFKKQGFDLNLAVVLRGMQDAMKGEQPLIDRKEMNATLTSLRKRVVAAREKAFREQAAENLRESNAFLEKNREKEGVVTLPSGLQYRVTKEGSGKSPKLDDTVTINYRGALINGTEFDSSYKRGKPERVHVKGVIPGWTEALQLMKEGSKWQLFVPPALAYGDRGRGSLIPPNSTLVFDVELVSIEQRTDTLQHSKQTLKKINITGKIAEKGDR